ncbi:MAG: hypothetical protein EOM37_09030 [Proteobacteria bacterium]|nr:hypothetical protein [Pseudomonadota bacterium]
MKIRFSQQPDGNSTLRKMYLSEIDNFRQRELEIFWELVGEKEVPLPQVYDGFVNSIIFFAMSIGENIDVEGALSRQYLRNINEMQDAWALWKPRTYKKICITSSMVFPEPSVSFKQESALAAYSGGIDSIFTMLRHADASRSTFSYPLDKSVLLVHGFDVPLSKKDQFESLQKRIAPLAEELGLNVKVIRTNSKELALQNWNDSFAAELSCCLHQYSDRYSYGLIGSSEPYDSLILPWGSSPVTDHLLSGDLMHIIHDGAAFSRTKKVEYISHNNLAVQVTKVCWEGLDLYKNCGKCEKCMRTLLNFMAVGVENPACFEEPLNIKNISGLKIHNETQLNELKSILEYATTKGKSAEPWALELKQLISTGVSKHTTLNKLEKKFVKLFLLVREKRYQEVLCKIKRDSLGFLRNMGLSI